jgi:hypothetical protein
LHDSALFCCKNGECMKPGISRFLPLFFLQNISQSLQFSGLPFLSLVAFFTTECAIDHGCSKL